MFTLFAIAIHQWPMSSPRYVPGRGRGATGFIGGVSRDEVGPCVGCLKLEVEISGEPRIQLRYKWG